MGWQKKGLIYCPDGSQVWAKQSFMTPTPLLLDRQRIRIYGGFRDEHGASRIGYVDVAADNPSRVLSVSKQPVIELGRPGMFDDNGMILGDVVPTDEGIRMYYVGFQLVKQAKFLAYSGVAISTDGGDSFKRYSKVPIMDRTDNALYIRAIHSVIYDRGIWKVWYSVGNGWQVIDGLPYPQYDIRYVESRDGLEVLDTKGVHCIGVGTNEYRIGRPRVRKLSNGTYEMRYTFDTLDKQYTAGYARSKDGVHWTRDDAALGIERSETGWDSEMVCYPTLLDVGDVQYMFYSGNGMGATGVGYAVWNE